MIERLLSILALKRGHNSIGEDLSVDRFLMPYEPTIFRDAKTKDVMAYAIVTDATSQTLFSCHVDTVHAATSIANVEDHLSVKNHVVFDANLGLAYKDKDDPTPLGADDGAGWWLMLEMIDAGVPGTYLFHRGEERGGIGSKWMAGNKEDFLKQFKRAIAFDRRGTSNVITCQGMDECCSNTFAVALADALNVDGLAFAPDDTGIYTDTAEYIGIIPECTNLSCGYEHEHSTHETLDVMFLQELRRAVINLAWEDLPVERTPMDRYSFDYMQYAYGRGNPSAYRGYKKGDKVLTPFDEFDLMSMHFRDVARFCRKSPEDAADLLLDLADKLMQRYETSDEDVDPVGDPSEYLDFHA